MRIKKQVKIYTLSQYQQETGMSLNELCRTAGKAKGAGGTYATRTNQHVLRCGDGIRLIPEDLALFLLSTN